MRNRKLIRITIILLTLFFITSFILSIIIPSDRTINMFWASLAFLFCGTLLDVNNWSKIGLDVDKKESKLIYRSFSDSTTTLSVYYGIQLCVIIFLESFNHNAMNNKLVIIGTFIMTIIFELFSYLSVYVAKRDTAKLLKNRQ